MCLHFFFGFMPISKEKRGKRKGENLAKAWFVLNGVTGGNLYREGRERERRGRKRE